MGQGDCTKFRARFLSISTPGFTPSPTDNDRAVFLAPQDGSDLFPISEFVIGTAPHFQMSPISTSGMPTSGFLFYLSPRNPDGPEFVEPLPGGFTVTVWVRDPSTYMWSAMAEATGVIYKELWVCTDVNAVDGVYFQFGNYPFDPGDHSHLMRLYLHFAEQ